MDQVKKGREELRHAVDQGEAAVVHAFDVAIGKADPLKTRKKTPAADLVTYLRAKKYKLALGKGTQSPRQRFMLDREGKVDFNEGPGTGLKHAEKREISGKWDELDMQLQEARLVVESTNRGLIDLNMALMMNAASLDADRHQSNLELDEQDYRNLAELMAAQRRLEQLSALATGLMTAYHAVVRDGRDPKMIGAYVTEASKGFPTNATVTSDEARAFVASLERDLPGSKERYEGWMKELYGPDELGPYQKGIDDKFTKIEALMRTPRGGAGGAGTRTAPRAAATVEQVAARAIDGKAMIAFKGIAALAQGDLKGALGAAASLVPAGPLQKGLSILTQFL